MAGLLVQTAPVGSYMELLQMPQVTHGAGGEGWEPTLSALRHPWMGCQLRSPLCPVLGFTLQAPTYLHEIKMLSLPTSWYCGETRDLVGSLKNSLIHS